MSYFPPQIYRIVSFYTTYLQFFCRAKLRIGVILVCTKGRVFIMKMLICFLSVYSLCLVAQAHAPVRFFQPSYGGSGCPVGSAEIVVSEDRLVSQIYLDKMVAETGASVEKSVDKKRCTILLPVQSEPGFQYKVVFESTGGYALLGQGARATVSHALSIPNGLKGPSAELKLSGPAWDEFSLEKLVSDYDQIWSHCGVTQSKVQISFVAEVIGGPDNPQSLVQVNPTGMYRLKWRPCHN